MGRFLARLLLFLVGNGVVSLACGFCVPDGWQSSKALTSGVVGIASGAPNITRSMGDVIYAPSQRRVLTDDDVDKGELKVMRIYDYPAKVLYTVRGHTNLTCTKTALNDEFEPLCVPENATMTHIKSYYGVNSSAYDNRKFFMEFEGQVKALTYRVSFTQIGFSPLFMQQWGVSDAGEMFFNTWEFYNSTIWGTLPPYIFTPPAVCNDVDIVADVSEKDARTGAGPFRII